MKEKQKLESVRQCDVPELSRGRKRGGRLPAVERAADAAVR